MILDWDAWARILHYGRPGRAGAGASHGRPMFRGLLKHNRCLVPASGFYEWKRDGGWKAPYYLRLMDVDLFAIAGLYDVWRDADGAAYRTYTLITTAANDVVAPLHDRMPVILKPEDEERWVAGGLPAHEELSSLLGLYPAGAMDAYPVPPRVNSPAVDDEQLIAPLS